MNGWFDSQGIEILGLDIMVKLQNCFGVLGLTGLDKLLSCATYNRLKNFNTKYNELLPSGMLEKYWEEL